MVDYEGNDYEEVMENVLSSMDNILDTIAANNEDNKKEGN